MGAEANDMDKKLELGREYPELDDPHVFERMVSLTVGQMEPIHGRLRRGQHAKATGCVTAEFRVADNVPASLRHGVFAGSGRTYRALVRLSNSQGTFEKDGDGTARGLAIKLLDVPGLRAVPGDRDDTQDFLLIDHPVFPFPNPDSYLAAISRKSLPLIGDLVAAAHLALLEPQELKVLKAVRSKRVANPLEIGYWSGAPFWLGSASGETGQAVKYSAASCQANRTTPPARPERLPADYFTAAMAASLRTEEAVFDFRVQVQTNAETMPIEDVSVEWSERDSPPVTVATLHIGPQPVDSSSDVTTECESRSFDPWHALAEHRPIGGMNRLRRVVYEASVAKRGVG